MVGTLCQGGGWSGGYWTSQALQTKWMIWGLCFGRWGSAAFKISSPLSSRSFNTPPKFGCSSSQMGFKLSSALLIWLLLEGPVESWHHGLSWLMTELLHSRGNSAINLHMEFASTRTLSLRRGRTRKVQLPIEGGGLTLVVWEHSRAAGELELVLLTSCQGHDFQPRGAAWRKIAREFQSVTCFVKESLAVGTWIPVVQCYTGGPYFACYSSSLKCSVLILPDENAFLSLLCGEAKPIF